MNIKNLTKKAIFFLIIVFTIYFSSVIFSFFWGKNVIIKKGNKIGLLKIEGLILSSENFIEQLEQFKKNDAIKAIIIRIESPGGAVVPSQEIYDAIVKFKEKTRKKVVVSLGSVAASGGYYIACAGDKIVSNPGSLTGSIAVIMKIPNLQGLFSKIGYEEQVIKSGRLKDLGSISRKMTQEERDILELMTKDVHEQFIQAVAKGRKLEIDSIRELADGRIFSGRQAKALKLVDRLGSLDDALDLASRLSGLTSKGKLITAKTERTFFTIIQDFLEQKLSLNPLSSQQVNLLYLFN